MWVILHVVVLLSFVFCIGKKCMAPIIVTIIASLVSSLSDWASCFSHRASRLSKRASILGRFPMFYL